MKKCKNIWIFNHYAITPDLPGGTRHFDFGKELVKRGYGVTIFAASFRFLYPRGKINMIEKANEYSICLPLDGIEK